MDEYGNTAGFVRRTDSSPKKIVKKERSSAVKETGKSYSSLRENIRSGKIDSKIAKYNREYNELKRLAEEVNSARKDAEDGIGDYSDVQESINRYNAQAKRLAKVGVKILAFDEDIKKIKFELDKAPKAIKVPSFLIGPMRSLTKSGRKQARLEKRVKEEKKKLDEALFDKIVSEAKEAIGQAPEDSIDVAKFASLSPTAIADTIKESIGASDGVKDDSDTAEVEPTVEPKKEVESPEVKKETSDGEIPFDPLEAARRAGSSEAKKFAHSEPGKEKVGGEEPTKEEDEATIGAIADAVSSMAKGKYGLGGKTEEDDTTKETRNPEKVVVVEDTGIVDPEEIKKKAVAEMIEKLAKEKYGLGKDKPKEDDDRKPKEDDDDRKPKEDDDNRKPKEDDDDRKPKEDDDDRKPKEDDDIESLLSKLKELVQIREKMVSMQKNGLDLTDNIEKYNDAIAKIFERINQHAEQAVQSLGTKEPQKLTDEREDEKEHSVGLSDDVVSEHSSHTSPEEGADKDVAPTLDNDDHEYGLMWAKAWDDVMKNPDEAQKLVDDKGFSKADFERMDIDYSRTSHDEVGKNTREEVQGRKAEIVDGVVEDLASTVLGVDAEAVHEIATSEGGKEKLRKMLEDEKQRDPGGYAWSINQLADELAVSSLQQQHNGEEADVATDKGQVTERFASQIRDVLDGKAEFGDVLAIKKARISLNDDTQKTM